MLCGPPALWSWDNHGSRCLLIHRGHFLTAERISAGEGGLDVDCLGVIPFLFQIRLFLFQAYFGMAWASFEAPPGGIAQSQGGAVWGGGFDLKHLCLSS